MEFIETLQFTNMFKKLGLADDVYRELQIDLAKNPTKGSAIVGTGGLRKIRMARSSHEGKSGGTRVIYYYPLGHHVIYMMVCYPKNVKDNLIDADKKAFKGITKRLKDKLDKKQKEEPNG